MLREKREKVIETVSVHLQNEKANIREAAITVLLNFSIIFLMKDDHEGRIQVLSALGGIANEKEA